METDPTDDLEVPFLLPNPSTQPTCSDEKQSKIEDEGREA